MLSGWHVRGRESSDSLSHGLACETADVVHDTEEQHQILQGSPPQVCSASLDAAECGGEGGRRSATVSKQDLLSALGESLGLCASSANLTGARNPALQEELQSALTWELFGCAFTHL